MKARNSVAHPAAALETAEFELVPTPSVTRSISLRNIDEVKHQMQKVFRDMRAGRIDTQDGTRLVYVLTQIAKLHESADLARRLDKLEELSYGDR